MRMHTEGPQTRKSSPSGQHGDLPLRRRLIALILLWSAVWVTSEFLTIPKSLTLAIAYFRVLLVVGFGSVLAAWIASFAFSKFRRVAGAGMILLILLFLLDPYSTGRIGGDQNLQPSYVWQSWFTGLLVALLAIALAWWRRGAGQKTFWTLLSEFVLFVSVNAVYYIRDGYQLRSFSGYDDSPAPLLVVGFGTVIRIGLLWNLARRSRDTNT
jgi:hypothetical protein